MIRHLAKVSRDENKDPTLITELAKEVFKPKSKSQLGNFTKTEMLAEEEPENQYQPDDIMVEDIPIDVSRDQTQDKTFATVFYADYMTSPNPN